MAWVLWRSWMREETWWQSLRAFEYVLGMLLLMAGAVLLMIPFLLLVVLPVVVLVRFVKFLRTLTRGDGR